MDITELTKWVVNRGDELYSLDKQFQFKRKLEQYAKEQLILSGVSKHVNCKHKHTRSAQCEVDYCVDCDTYIHY